MMSSRTKKRPLGPLSRMPPVPPAIVVRMFLLASVALFTSWIQQYHPTWSDGH